MRKLFVILALTITTTAIVAENVSSSKARKTALLFLQQHRSNAELKKSLVRAVRPSDDEAPAYYIFNTRNNEGYVLVSGESTMPEVLGYGLEGQWPDNENKLAPTLRAILEGYVRYVADVRAGKVAPLISGSTQATGDTVAPMLTTNWTQEWPYNMYAPLFNDDKYDDDESKGHNAIGCGAVATAQVIHYHAVKNPGKLEHPRNRWTYFSWIDSVADPVEHYDTVMLSQDSTTYYHAQIPDSISYTPERSHMDSATWATKCQLTGRFLRDVAYAMNMEWSKDGGSSARMAGGMAAEMAFGFSHDVRYAQAFAIGELAQSEHIERIRKELLTNGPVIMASSDSRGPSGHSFVCDGIDSRNFLHINFGWANIDNSNNWFDPAIMNANRYTTDPKVDPDKERYNKEDVYTYNLHLPTATEDSVRFDDSRLVMDPGYNEFEYGNGDYNLENYVIKDDSFPPVHYVDKTITTVNQVTGADSFDKPHGFLTYDLITGLRSQGVERFRVDSTRDTISGFDKYCINPLVQQTTDITKYVDSVGTYYSSGWVRQLTADTIGAWKTIIDGDSLLVTSRDYVHNIAVYDRYAHAATCCHYMSKDSSYIMAHLDYVGDPDRLKVGDSLILLPNFYFILNKEFSIEDTVTSRGILVRLIHGNRIETLLPDTVVNLDSMYAKTLSLSRPGLGYCRPLKVHLNLPGYYEVLINCPVLPDFNLIDRLYVEGTSAVDRVSDDSASGASIWLKNGRLFLRRGNTLYDLNGRKVM